jgi:hypothetical protein
MKLIKLSGPEWEKEFTSEEELKRELYANICDICRSGFKDYVGTDGEMKHYEDWVFPPVTAESSLMDMFGTSCGCEFDWEE